MTPEDEDSLLAAEFALGVLQGPARDDFTRRLSADPVLAAEVRYWDEHFANLTNQVAPVAPPVNLQTQLEDRLFGTAEKQSLWNSLGLWRGLAFAAVTALVLIAAWNLQPVPTGPQEALVAQGGRNKFREAHRIL